MKYATYPLWKPVSLYWSLIKPGPKKRSVFPPTGPGTVRARKTSELEIFFLSVSGLLSSAASGVFLGMGLARAHTEKGSSWPPLGTQFFFIPITGIIALITLFFSTYLLRWRRDVERKNMTDDALKAWRDGAKFVIQASLGQVAIVVTMTWSERAGIGTLPSTVSTALLALIGTGLFATLATAIPSTFSLTKPIHKQPKDDHLFTVIFVLLVALSFLDSYSDEASKLRPTPNPYPPLSPALIYLMQHVPPHLDFLHP